MYSSNADPLEILARPYFEKRKWLIKQPGCKGPCPPGTLHMGVRRCCLNCETKEFIGGPESLIEHLGLVSEADGASIRELWTEGTGFWTENGCLLPRYLRPTHCLEWDCKEELEGKANENTDPDTTVRP